MKQKFSSQYLSIPLNLKPTGISNNKQQVMEKKNRARNYLIFTINMKHYVNES